MEYEWPCHALAAAVMDCTDPVWANGQSIRKTVDRPWGMELLTSGANAALCVPSCTEQRLH